jgi:hypothetical protein
MTFFCFGDVIGVVQVWCLSVNLLSNKVTVIVQFFLYKMFLAPFNEVCRHISVPLHRNAAKAGLEFGNSG